MDNIQDWCISRQLWWGHRIPAWYDDAGNTYVGEDETAIRKKYSLKDDVALTQDEDVLDTWFSSALWPFSTLGWPEKTPELDVFYPTNVLITGFDIIFFWVARMIMMALKFTGQVPFKEVYIHGLITLVKKRTANMLLSKQAQKIEKQTRQEFPNGIPSFGTDAVRFTFCAQTSTSRQIPFDLNRVEGYRNFCNKIWNAARFVLMNTEEFIPKEKVKLPKSLPDQYIISKLSATITTVKEHLNAYRCDWYLELTRPLLKDNDPDVVLATRYTLLEMLEALLRLLHPFIPYITEEIWQRVAPLLSINTTSIMIAPYPDEHQYPIHQYSMQTIDWIKQIIANLRNMRGEMNVPPRKPISVYIKNASFEDKNKWQEQTHLLTELAFIDKVTYVEDEASLGPCAKVIVGNMEILVQLAGLIDPQAEIVRLEKLLLKTQKEQEKLAQKLNNPHYCANIKPEILSEEQNKLAELTNVIEKTKLQKTQIESHS
jgi:valyl-tRNA synthetase